MDNTFYVYALTDPRTNRPFYIGKGKGDRDKSHLTEARGPREKWINKIKCQIINNIEANNRQIVVEKIKEKLTEADAYQLEFELIEKYGKIIDGSGILSNIADGGDGGVGGLGQKPVQSYTLTGALIKSYISLSAAAEDTGIHKSTICAALNGRTCCAGGVRWAYVGELPTFQPLNKFTPVSQFSIAGEYIQTFDSIKVAASAVGVIHTSIIMCCRGYGNCRTAGGFRWAYKNELPFPVPEGFKNQSRKRVLQSVDQFGHIIGEFNSIKEAVAKTSANATGISDCCAGRKKTSGGVGWRWAD